MADYDKYLGTYNRVSADQYEEFLKELGVSWPLRKAAMASSPAFIVSIEIVISIPDLLVNFRISRLIFHCRENTRQFF